MELFGLWVDHCGIRDSRLRHDEGKIISFLGVSCVRRARWLFIILPFDPSSAGDPWVDGSCSPVST